MEPLARDPVNGKDWSTADLPPTRANGSFRAVKAR
jgi:hypothetical protein